MAHIFCSRYISRLIKFVCLIGIVFHCTAAMSAYTFTNMVTGGVLTTPTTYEVTITKVEFQKSSGSYVTFVEELTYLIWVLVELLPVNRLVFAQEHHLLQVHTRLCA